MLRSGVLYDHRVTIVEENTLVRDPDRPATAENIVQREGMQGSDIKRVQGPDGKMVMQSTPYPAVMAGDIFEHPNENLGLKDPRVIKLENQQVRDGLERLTVEQLQELALANEVDLGSHKKKAVILSILRAYEVTPN